MQIFNTSHCLRNAGDDVKFANRSRRYSSSGTKMAQQSAFHRIPDFISPVWGPATIAMGGTSWKSVLGLSRRVAKGVAESRPAPAVPNTIRHLETTKLDACIFSSAGNEESTAVFPAFAQGLGRGERTSERSEAKTQTDTLVSHRRENIIRATASCRFGFSRRFAAARPTGCNPWA